MAASAWARVINADIPGTAAPASTAATASAASSSLNVSPVCACRSPARVLLHPRKGGMVRVRDRSPLWALSDSGVGNQPDSARLTPDAVFMVRRGGPCGRPRMGWANAGRDKPVPYGRGPTPACPIDRLVGAALVAARSQRFANRPAWDTASVSPTRSRHGDSAAQIPTMQSGDRCRYGGSSEAAVLRGVRAVRRSPCSATFVPGCR